jgi:hypothetical protein
MKASGVSFILPVTCDAEDSCRWKYHSKLTAKESLYSDSLFAWLCLEAKNFDCRNISVLCYSGCHWNGPVLKHNPFKIVLWPI